MFIKAFPFLTCFFGKNLKKLPPIVFTFFRIALLEVPDNAAGYISQLYNRFVIFISILHNAV